MLKIRIITTFVVLSAGCVYFCTALDASAKNVDYPQVPIVGKGIAQNGSEIRDILNQMIEDAKKACPTCYLPVSDKPTDFPIARVPGDFLVTGEVKSLSQLGGQYSVLLDLLKREKQGWRFLHPVSEIGSQEEFLEFVSGPMRLTCTKSGMIAEYIIKSEDDEFKMHSDAFLLARHNSSSLPRLFFTDEKNTNVAPSYDQESAQHIRLFPDMQDNSSNAPAIKRVIISKSFPCRAALPRLTGVQGDDNNAVFH